MSESGNANQMHKSQWRLRQVTDELNARPFPRFALPTAIFRLCLSGDAAFDGLRDILSDTLPQIDWDNEGQSRLIRARHDEVQFNIERHTEFVSLTIIDERAESGSAAQYLPSDWLEKNRGEVVVAVDCQCSLRGAAREGWTCASQLENGLADGFFDFKVAEDGHTKIALDFAPDSDVRDVGRIALQVVEIETYRSFAAIGLNRARAAQAQLADIAARVPPSISAAGSADGERFELLSQLTGELEDVWRRTSFRFAACTAYWDLVTARLASLQEQAYDSRITIGGFLERRLQPAIATYQSTERRRHDLAEQIAAMTGLLQTRIELDMQQQNADLLASLNHSAARQLRLQHTVEGVSTVAISYYLVNLLRAPADWVLARQPALDPLIVNMALVAITVPLVWLTIRRLLRATVGGKKGG
ncbi:DUF3422 domain-containing protein [Alphaproteobacteria bacterium]|jgi:uncharacterized membrane-anchored protein|nr:DUF3422 domain-containing protein [Alphaproteobacteria bacterium]MDA8667377.1 DUF3422 domain-containing protein [Alphaproteobacteria bacterium]MDB2380980.1 DUF3422 domain-containing protein [Alphaproteobacteria bacterium]MDB2432204.1 DUF3422 domain-containing protein [Alphaproteobacteria bacterium]MDB2462250.1 DUF3422 domain-containing protein [Alphaproteobacteria bacterium]